MYLLDPIEFRAPIAYDVTSTLCTPPARERLDSQEASGAVLGHVVMVQNLYTAVGDYRKEIENERESKVSITHSSEREGSWIYRQHFK